MALRRASAQDSLREVVDREHPRDAAGLLAQLKSGDAEQRRWAARDLVGLPETAGHLGEHLLRETDASVREAVFTTLAAQASEAAAGALLPLLRSEDAVLRNGAIEALGGMPQAVAPRIAALLHDADPDVRIFTVNLLGELRHPQVPAWLLQVLRHEAQVNVVAAAIEVLAEVGDASHAEAVRGAVQRFANDPFIAFAAELALERIATSS
jgi:HEAT repeat protein